VLRCLTLSISLRWVVLYRVRYSPILLILRIRVISDPMASLVIALIYDIRVGLRCIIALGDISVFSIVVIGDYWFI
jgi:hypothetical protein